MKVKNSSFVKDVKFNNGTLTIVFEYQDRNQLREYHSIYKFYGVPKVIADGFKYTDHPGKYFRMHVRDSYRYMRVL